MTGCCRERYGPLPLIAPGLLLTAAGTLAFAWAGPATSQWLLAGSLFIRGAGLTAVTIAVLAGAFDSAFWWAIALTALALIPAILPKTRPAGQETAAPSTPAMR